MMKAGRGFCCCSKHSDFWMMKALAILLVMAAGWQSKPQPETARRDSIRAVKVVPKVFPQESKRDYKRFMKFYDNDELFAKLIQGKDSSQVQRLLGEGVTITLDVFELTFSFTDSAFNYALLYQNHFGDFSVKPEQWYLQQFAILFNAEGKAYKIFDHETRGYNLFDKRKKKSI